jgi:hypothetical protein
VKTLLVAVLVAGMAAMSGVAGTERGQSASGPTPQSSVNFASIARAAGIDFQPINGASAEKYLVETMGSGGVLFDFDNDGWTDVFLVDGGSLVNPQAAARARHRLFRNRGNGRFDDVTAASGIVHDGYGMGACAADYDNDGFADLYVTNFASNTLFHNLGNGKFRDVTRAAGVGWPEWSTSCAFADFDKDGLVDLFVTNYLDARTENNKYCGDPVRHQRVYCHPLNYRPLASVLYHNDAAESSATSAVGRGLRTTEGTAPASSSLTMTMTAGQTCSWRMTRCRIFSSTTRDTAFSRKWRCIRASPSATTARPGREWGPISATTMATAGSI